jgi:hypothetical protein
MYFPVLLCPLPHPFERLGHVIFPALCPGHALLVRVPLDASPSLHSLLTIGHGWQPPQYVVQISVGLDAVTPTAFDDRVDAGAAFSGIGVPEK